MAKKFDRNGFIQEAQTQGYGADEINAYLTSIGQKPVGKLETLVRSPIIPTIGGLAGATGGALLGGAFGAGVGSIPGGAAGGAVGAGAGVAAQKSLEGLLGYSDPYSNPDQNLSDTGSAATAGAIGGAGLGALKIGTGATLALLKKVYDMLTLNPQLAKLGAQREDLASKINVDPQVLEQAGKKASERAVSPDVAQKVNELWSSLYSKLTPITGVAENASPNIASAPLKETSSINLKNIYDQLKILSGETNAYGGSAQTSTAGKYIDSAVRDLANSEAIRQGVPKMADVNAKLSELYKLAPQAENFKRTAERGVTNAAVYGGLGSLLYAFRNQIGKLFGGQ